MAEVPEPQDLSQVPVVCPLCHQVHERCEFRAEVGVLLRPGCRNPHHREPPADATSGGAVGSGRTRSG